MWYKDEPRYNPTKDYGSKPDEEYMAEFDSWLSYHSFTHSVRHKSRYIFEGHVEKFLQTVIATSSKRILKIPKSAGVWRAQLGHDWMLDKDIGEQVEVPFPPERMIPLPNSAREGRVNPKGIPCLYIATDKETAMAEVRPWIGSYISIGQFEVLKELTVVDCSMKTDGRTVFYFSEPEQAEREASVWKDINRAFSEPTTSNDATADYAPTQILAEVFRSQGYDGVVYKSTLGKGHNIALFDLSVASLANCSLFQVKKMSFEFSQAANTYWVNKPIGTTTESSIDDQGAQALERDDKPLSDV